MSASSSKAPIRTTRSTPSSTKFIRFSLNATVKPKFGYFLVNLRRNGMTCLLPKAAAIKVTLAFWSR
ncbi:hypothetical protein ADUPG1_003263, partial [Aduncisulcus paluster]